MATASAGRADKGSSRGSRAFRAPLQRARLAVGGQGRGEGKPKARQPSSCAQTQGATMSDPEIEDLRNKVHCAVVLERTPPPWMLDRKESTKLSLKYRRGKGEILIVSHGGKGWWDPTSDAKGDVFSLVQRLEPGVNFGHVRRRLREFAASRRAFRSPRGQGAAKLRTDPSPNVGPIGRPCGRIRRPGAISPGNASFHRRSSRRLLRPASCGRARPAAPGSLMSTARVPSPTSTSAGRPTKARLPVAPSLSSVCPRQPQSTLGSFSPRPRLTL